MAVQMPVSKKFSIFYSFFFGFSSIILFDLITKTLGLWTLFTSVTYGIIGVGSYFYFNSNIKNKNYVKYTIIATILYDALTGLTVGPLFFGQSFAASFFGQIPFTIYHLLSNVTFAMILSPVIESVFIRKEKFNFLLLKNKILKFI
jgi:uncharacterized membrane protein YuzA (DUF378 family)